MNKRFAWSHPPIPGESLMGFVTRNADIHAADKVSAVLRAAGIDTIVPESLPTVHREKAPELARLFMTSPEEIQARTYPPAAVPGPPNSFASFFGTPLRRIYLESYRRRVSPASLRASGHHRALWDVRPLSFCCESREMLVSSCPECEAELGWRWTFGPAFCEICGVDLRDFSQPKVEVADDAALDFVVDLIHPDPDRRERARGAAPAAFGKIGIGSGELFELAVAMAATLADQPSRSQTKIARGASLEDYARLTPTILSEAGRIILDWPQGFEAYLRRMRSGQAGGGAAAGPKSQFGSARLLTRDRHLAQVLRHEIGRAIDASLNDQSFNPTTAYRTRTNADSSFQVAKELGIDHHMVARWAENGFVSAVRKGTGGRTITVVDRDEVALLTRRWKDAVPAARVRERLGVDALAVRELAAAGLVEEMDGPAAFSMKGGDAYSSSALDRLVDAVKARAVAAPENGRGQSLSSAAMRFARGRVPWVPVFEAILDGRLKVHMRQADEGTALIKDLFVSDEDGLQAVLDGGAPADIHACRARLSIGEAAAYLGTKERAVSRFIADGLLPVIGSDKWKLERSAVEEFNRRYMLAREISRTYGIPYAFLTERLSANGLRAANPDAGKNYAWPRDQIEAAFRRSD